MLPILEPQMVHLVFWCSWEVAGVLARWVLSGVNFYTIHYCCHLNSSNEGLERFNWQLLIWLWASETRTERYILFSGSWNSKQVSSYIFIAWSLNLVLPVSSLSSFIVFSVNFSLVSANFFTYSFLPLLQSSILINFCPFTSETITRWSRMYCKIQFSTCFFAYWKRKTAEENYWPVCQAGALVPAAARAEVGEGYKPRPRAVIFPLRTFRDCCLFQYRDSRAAGELCVSWCWIHEFSSTWKAFF